MFMRIGRIFIKEQFGIEANATVYIDSISNSPDNSVQNPLRTMTVKNKTRPVNPRANSKLNTGGHDPIYKNVQEASYKSDTFPHFRQSTPQETLRDRRKKWNLYILHPSSADTYTMILKPRSCMRGMRIKPLNG